MKQPTEEIRKLSKRVAKNPALADLIGSIFYDISKFGARRLNALNLEEINEIDEAEIIPSEVKDFLKKKKNVPMFIDSIREEILQLFYSDEEMSTEVIVRYSTYFNISNLKRIEVKNSKIIKLILVVCMEKEKIFQDVMEADIRQIEQLYENLNLDPEKEDDTYLRAVVRVGKFLL